MNLTKDHFLSLAQSHNTIPICEELVFDAHTPLAVFNQFKQEESFVFLEGVSTHQRYGRYSYLALDPYKSLLCYENSYDVIKGDFKETFSGTVYDALETELAAIKYPDESPEFYSGIIGNLSYECLHHLDAVTPPKQRSLKTPYAAFMIPKTLLVFDTLYHKLTIVRVVFLGESLSQDVLETLYDDACNEIVKLKEKCATLPPIEPVFLFNDAQKFPDDVSEDDKKSRVIRLNDLQNAIGLKKNQALIGTTQAVLIEALSTKKSSNEVQGRTDCNRIVILPKQNHELGQTLPCLITDATRNVLKGSV